MGAYVKTTDRCRCKDRYFSVRAMRRDRPDSPHKLAEMLTRLTSQEAGRTNYCKSGRQAAADTPIVKED